MNSPVPQNKPIGLYDSGIGGLSVVREVWRQLPAESVHYLADTARVPYGGRSPQEISRFNQEALAYLLAQKVKVVLVACNTSCAVALATIRSECPVPLVGLIAAGARAALSHGKRLAILATEVTVQSGAYQLAIQSLDDTAEVQAIACPQFVPLVEAGQYSGNHVEQVVADTLAPLTGRSLDAVVLGCTHYPFLLEPIRKVLGTKVALVDPAGEAVQELGWLLRRHGLLTSKEAVAIHKLAVTGDPAAFARQAIQIFEGTAWPIERVFLPVMPHSASYA